MFPVSTSPSATSDAYSWDGIYRFFPSIGTADNPIFLAVWTHINPFFQDSGRRKEFNIRAGTSHIFWVNMGLRLIFAGLDASVVVEAASELGVSAMSPSTAPTASLSASLVAV